MRIVILENGSSFPPESDILRRTFGFQGKIDEMIDDAVRDCGAVLLQYSLRKCQILLRPGDLSTPAFEKLIEYLCEWENKPIIILPAGAGTAFRDVLLNVPDAIFRLDQYRRDPKMSPDGLRFWSSPHSVRRLPNTTRRPTLRAAYDEWLKSRGQLSRRRLSQMLDHPTGTDWLMAKVDADRLPVTLTMPRYINHWNVEKFDFVGKPMIEHEDKIYGEASSQSFLDVHRSQEPLLETIDAVIVPSGVRASRLRYDRLLLPWRIGAGDIYLSNVAHLRVEDRPELSLGG